MINGGGAPHRRPIILPHLFLVFTSFEELKSKNGPPKLVLVVGGEGREFHRFEVVDILNGNTTVHLTMIDAAREIGCHQSTISKAFKNLKEKGGGVTRLIKKR